MARCPSIASVVEPALEPLAAYGLAKVDKGRWECRRGDLIWEVVASPVAHGSPGEFRVEWGVRAPGEPELSDSTFMMPRGQGHLTPTVSGDLGAPLGELVRNGQVESA